jgi:hypothetical protein
MAPTLPTRHRRSEITCYASDDISCSGTPIACGGAGGSSQQDDDLGTVDNAEVSTKDPPGEPMNCSDPAIYFVQTAEHGKMLATVHDDGSVTLVIRLEGLSDTTTW